MSALSKFLLTGSRQVAVWLAIAAILMAAFRVHAHPHAGHALHDQHSHACELSAEATQTNVTSEIQLADLDGCDRCTCALGDIFVVDRQRLILDAPAVTLSLLICPTVTPESLHYPPDLPPVRLG